MVKKRIGAALWMMAALGPEQVVSYARRFGLTSPLPPYLPIAIGAGDASLIEMTSAYTAFANLGVRMSPQPLRQVTDKDGNIKFEYSIEKNSELARNLKGRLMLVTGDMDDNVHMQNSAQLADALGLIEALGVVPISMTDFQMQELPGNPSRRVNFLASVACA